MSGAIVMISTFNANGRAINYLGNNYDNGRPIGSAKSQHSSELSSTPPIRQTINKKGPNTMTNSLSPANLVAWCTAFFCAQVTESAPTFTVSKTRGGTMSAARPASLALLAVILGAVIAFVAVDETKAQAVFGLAVTADTRSSAEATVTVTGAGSIHLRFRLTGTTEWTTLNAATASASDTEVEFTLNGLTPNAVYEVEASQADNFPATDATVSVNFANRPSDRDLDLTGDNTDPAGIWCNGETMYVLDDGDRRIHAYSLETGAPLADLGFDLHDEHSRPRGVSGDADTMWIASRGGLIYAYTIQAGTSYGQRDETKEFFAETDDGYPAGVWSDGNLMWVVNYVDEQTFAFDVSGSGTYGARVSDSDFSLATHYSSPLGMWSDGDTFWVVDSGRDRLFAYADGTRQPARGIKLVDDNASPWGVCGVDDVLYVADRGDGKVYAYFVPPEASGDITNISINLVEDRKATITVEFNNPDSDTKSVKLRYGIEPDGETVETDAVDTTGTEVEFSLTGLSRDTEYRLAVILGNETLATGGFRAWSTTDTAQRHLKVAVVERFQEAFPWTREAYREMRRRGMSVRAAEGGNPGQVITRCGESGGGSGLHRCRCRQDLRVSNSKRKNTDVMVHELAHVWTIGSDYMRHEPESRGMGWLYFAELARGGNDCPVEELYADGMTKVVRTGYSSIYFSNCSNTPNSPSAETRDAAASVMAYQIPTWFIDQYESERSAIRHIHSFELRPDVRPRAGMERRQTGPESSHVRPAAVYAFRSAFGGYCNDRTTHQSAHHGGPVRNPWKAGGCVPQAVEARVESGGSVAWDAPSYDGGAPIRKYVVEWKAPR